MKFKFHDPAKFSNNFRSVVGIFSVLGAVLTLVLAVVVGFVLIGKFLNPILIIPCMIVLSFIGLLATGTIEIVSDKDDTKK